MKANYMTIYVTGEDLKNLDRLVPRVLSVLEVAHGFSLHGMDKEALEMLSGPNAVIEYIVKLGQLVNEKRNES